MEKIANAGRINIKFSDLSKKFANDIFLEFPIILFFMVSVPAGIYILLCALYLFFIFSFFYVLNLARYLFGCFLADNN